MTGVVLLLAALAVELLFRLGLYEPVVSPYSHSGTTITVTVSMSVPTRFLPGPMSVSATESATAVAGI